MREIVAADQPFVRERGRPRRRPRALRRPAVQARDHRATLDASEGRRRGSVISVYRNPRDGDASQFVDLCRGPHVPVDRPPRARSSCRRSPARTGAATSTARCSSASTAPRGSRPQALEEHLHRLEEAERRDHRTLGAELDLFSFPEEIGSGLAVFHPKGALVRKLMEDYSRSGTRRAGYQFVELAAHLEGEPVRDVRAPRLVRRRHVPADDARRRHRRRTT